MAQILYYSVLKPLSLLPLWLLFKISDFLYLVIYYVAGYRKKVVRKNLTESFPEKTSVEITAIMKKFYRHLCDIIVESIKLFSITESDARNRFQKINPEILDRFYLDGKSLIIVAGHFNNWEMAGTTFNFQMAHQTNGIYAPMSNSFFEKKFRQSRSKFGVSLVPMKKVHDSFQQNEGVLTATVFGADQSPTGAKKVYWTHFLNQETAVFLGAERYAHTYNLPVVYANVNKIKRGFYQMEFEILEEQPSQAKEGIITEKHIRALEKQIFANPEYWLWTHKRWKRKRLPNEELSQSVGQEENQRNQSAA